MPTVNNRLADAETLHNVNLQRYSNGVVRRMLALLNRVDGDLFNALQMALENAGTQITVERLESLLFSVRQLNVQAYRTVERELSDELRKFTAQEVSYQHTLFQTVVPKEVVVTVGLNVVNADQVYAAAMARPFQGTLLNEALSGLEAGRAKLVRDAVRMGVVESETIPQIVRRIRGTKAAGYADGLLEAPRRHIEAIVRTAVNHTQNFAKQSYYKANSDVVAAWVFVATLDGRTSLTCASLSGKKFPIGEGPQPPRHWNCRSVASPVTKSWRELGIDIDEIAPGTRASMDGQVPEDLTFSAWLRNKPAAVQDDILGATRGKLYRANEIEVDRFTNNKGVVYSLDVLRKKDAALFERAGI